VFADKKLATVLLSTSEYYRTGTTVVRSGVVLVHYDNSTKNPYDEKSVYVRYISVVRTFRGEICRVSVFRKREKLSKTRFSNTVVTKTSRYYVSLYTYTLYLFIDDTQITGLRETRSSRVFFVFLARSLFSSKNPFGSR